MIRVCRRLLPLWGYLAPYTDEGSVTALRKRLVLGGGDHQHEAAGLRRGRSMDGASKEWFVDGCIQIEILLVGEDKRPTRLARQTGSQQLTISLTRRTGA